MLQYQRGEESPHKLKQKISQITQDKIFRGAMNISDIATVRTGLVKARKEKNNSSDQVYNYSLLNLKCISNDGDILIDYLEPYTVSDELKEDYLTHLGDVLVRLSTPYTVAMIDSQDLCGLVIPSHFAVIRVNREMATPEYVFWSLRRDKNRITLMQNSSGGAAFATISSGLIANLPITLLPLEKQRIIGKVMLLSEREQNLISKLAGEKKKYNSLLLNKIYDNLKRGNINDNQTKH